MSRKLIASTLITLDGVMQDPGGFGETKDGGWAGPYADPEIGQVFIEALRDCDTFLCGEVTYNLLSKAWAGGSGEYMNMINNMPKLVASTSLQEPLEWNAKLIQGDVPEAVAKLKQQPGKDIMMYGSATLMRSLAEHGLIDTYKVWIYPLVLGSGKRLFPEGYNKMKLDLMSAKTFSSGVVLLSYEPARSVQNIQFS
jgi:dihydrofolate reductase